MVNTYTSPVNFRQKIPENTPIFLFVICNLPPQVSFKKTKLPREEGLDNPSHFASFKNRYFAMKKRNMISGILLGFLGIS